MILMEICNAQMSTPQLKALNKHKFIAVSTHNVHLRLSAIKILTTNT